MRAVHTFKLAHGEATTLDVHQGFEVLAVRDGQVYIAFDERKPLVQVRIFSADDGRSLPDWASKASYLGSYEVEAHGTRWTTHAFRMPGM